MTDNPYILLSVFFVVVGLSYAAWKFKWNKVFISGEIRRKTAIEDILKQLYHVEYSGRKATLNAMAGALKLSHTRLVELIQEMGEINLLRTKGDTLELTQSGRDYALRIIRVHRLWEKYLSEKTGIDRSEWHSHAEKMEHTLSRKDADELYRELGNPRFDPHGDPIPMASGEIIETNAVTLSSIQSGSLVRIIHIEDEPDTIYQQIIDQKLHMGQQLQVIDSNDQQVTFRSEGTSYTLSTIVASNIGVKELSNEEVFEANTIRLSSLNEGEKAKVIGISSECRGAARRRLLDLGFIKGTIIETEMQGPSSDPKAYKIRNTLIALRSDQADLILIEKVK
ncbi:DtxR family transcriptional regulator [Marinoscillum sp.]|uniref:metal-dependent transcriptional regulator n=1 Tax=Marinoscillum sp. TaxID=2024838 RepID=UPI003BAB63D4